MCQSDLGLADTDCSLTINICLTLCRNDVTDPDSWRRNTGTRYKDGKLSWSHRHETTGSVYFSYFPPFSQQRHLSLIAHCQQSPKSTILQLGESLEGRPIEAIQVGNGEKVAWIIHRQHPGETMAEYFAEGLLHRLLSDNDSAVADLLSLYTLYIVPCMCPDGAARGCLRTNGAGANLNREWASSTDYEAPTAERSPEVLCVWNKMLETGVDFFLDVHGDEELPYCFLAGVEQTANWGPRLAALHGAFLGAYARSTSDMQKPIGYPPPTFATDALPCIGSNAVANRFDCLSNTLEMPFKDCRTNPDPKLGWSPQRARDFGAAVVEPMIYVCPYLRNNGDFWNNLLPDDAYIAPTNKIS